MRWSESSEFGFALGRVRALEPQLLDRSRYERFVTASDNREFLSLLRDAGYGRFAGQREDAGIEELLSAAHIDNAVFLVRYCHLPEVHALFFLAANLNRLKAMVKLKLGAIRTQETFAEETTGMWGREQLDALATADKAAQPDVIRLAVASILSAPEKAEPSTVDLVLDVAGGHYLTEVVGAFPFLRELVALRADTTNLCVLVRSRAREESPADLTADLLPGGLLGPRELEMARGADWDGVVAAFRDTRYGEMVAAGVGFLRERQSFIRMERLAREEVLRFLQQTRYVSSGYEPLLAFCLQREEEIANLRLLHAAKLAGMPQDTCREVVACVN